MIATHALIYEHISICHCHNKFCGELIYLISMTSLVSCNMHVNITWPCGMPSTPCGMDFEISLQCIKPFTGCKTMA